MERFFPEFLALLFPRVHAGIDWSKEIQFLDKEFQQIVREAKTTRRYADKLVGVTLRDGTAAWVLIHVVRLIDWMIRLPAGLEADFRQALYAYEEQQRMPYVTTVEQAGIEKGLKQGVKQGLKQGVKQGEAMMLLALLQEKFGPDTADAYRERITAAEPEQLLQWSIRILSAETPETIFH